MQITFEKRTFLARAACVGAFLLLLGGLIGWDLAPKVGRYQKATFGNSTVVIDTCTGRIYRAGFTITLDPARGLVFSDESKEHAEEEKQRKEAEEKREGKP